MKITNVTPGLMPVPPHGWGAVERIIWEIHLNLQSMGHTSEIKYLDDVSGHEDVVHIHVANLANMAHERGIPYYFTMHDHHAYLYGKGSDLYKENLLAMQNAVKAWVPARYLVKYFNGIPEYFSHGVNTDYFTPSTEEKTGHRLLCVANNGYAYNQSIDRKGFGIAISAARSLGLPITIVGPSNNSMYFTENPPTYDKLEILYDVTNDELVDIYKRHTIFVHPSQLEAGHPNLTLLEAMSCGLPTVGTFESGYTLPGMKVVPASVETVVDGITEVMNDYTKYSIAAREQAELLSWKNRTKVLLSHYPKPSMKKELTKHYNETVPLKKSTLIKTVFHNIDGMYAEILGGPAAPYEVKFIDRNTNSEVYTTTIERNCWAQTSTKYFVNWKVEIRNTNTNEVVEHRLRLRNSRVYIALESKSLGDTLAWISAVEEFRKKNFCKVICSTFWNQLFISEYPNIEFVSPGDTVDNLYAMYSVGVFYTDEAVDNNKHPTNPLAGSLQKIAWDILGLDYKEVRPKMKQPDISNEDSKQVCIAMHSTAQLKYWNNPTGWQEVVDWLTNKGYTVKMLSTEHDGYMGNKNPTGIVQHPESSIEEVIAELKKSKAFIGISSGLSWVSWATGIPTILISGFTDPKNEMADCIRISAPESKCSGCWHRYKFNPGDWNWCPDHKETPKQFECSKGITAEMVIKELEKIL